MPDQTSPPVWSQIEAHTLTASPSLGLHIGRDRKIASFFYAIIFDRPHGHQPGQTDQPGCEKDEAQQEHADCRKSKKHHSLFHPGTKARFFIKLMGHPLCFQGPGGTTSVLRRPGIGRLHSRNSHKTGQLSRSGLILPIIHTKTDYRPGRMLEFPRCSH